MVSICDNRIKLNETIIEPCFDAHDNKQLFKLAKIYNIVTSYNGSDKKMHTIKDTSIQKVLTSLGVLCTTNEEINQSLYQAELKLWLQPLKQTIVEIQGYESEIDIYLPSTTMQNLDTIDLTILFENGTHNKTSQRYSFIGNVSEPIKKRIIDNCCYEQRTFKLPCELPLGYHKIVLQLTNNTNTKTKFISHLIVTPEVAPIPKQQLNGIMTQFYSNLSQKSWGVGDFADLRTLGSKITQKLKSDFLLINPVHADVPNLPQTSSPYSPVSRRWLNPIYVRPEEIVEFQTISLKISSRVKSLSRMAQQLNSCNSTIDRNTCWALKKEALFYIFSQAKLSTERLEQFNQFKAKGSSSLTSFALWSLLTDYYGIDGSWRNGTLKNDDILQFALEHSEEIEFYKWLQWIADQQMQQVHKTMCKYGARIGLINDLAVGVCKDGADIWVFPEAYLKNLSIGAPPDVYNQQGQNWSLPALSPEYLERTGYKIYHDLVRAALCNAGCLRIDHILGMFRLWLVPDNSSAVDGAYLYYNHHALIGVLALEAVRSNSYIIGEDMGTIPVSVFDYLKKRGIMGTSVLWFERENDGQVTAPQDLRTLCLTMATTHDLPPSLGYIQGEHVKLRSELGLLAEESESVWNKHRKDIETVRNFLVANDFLEEQKKDDDYELVIALNRLLLEVPSKLIGFSLVDFVGEYRTENQPGTVDEYPNWRIPLRDRYGNNILNEGLFNNQTFQYFVNSIPKLKENYSKQLKESI